MNACTVSLFGRSNRRNAASAWLLGSENRASQNATAAPCVSGVGAGVGAGEASMARSGSAGATAVLRGQTREDTLGQERPGEGVKVQLAGSLGHRAPPHGVRGEGD